MKITLQHKGYALYRTSVSASTRAELRASVFRVGEAGARCLLDIPIVWATAEQIGKELIDVGALADNAVAIQAIAFDKSPEVNWKVTWHQDLMFPFAELVSSAQYELACVKDGVNFARPPRGVLENLLAVRLHLDDCDEDNGPLRVAPGTHTDGIVPSAQIHERVTSEGERVCLAKEGEALLMRPLLLHSSSKATVPRHRRVLHVVYYSGPSLTEKWYRAVQPNQAAPVPTAERPGPLCFPTVVDHVRFSIER